MKEHNRLRIERLVARHSRRLEETRTPEAVSFLRAFDALRASVLKPKMEEIAEELRKAGHDARILLNQAQETPSIELVLDLRGGTAQRNAVGFCIIEWQGYPLQILAYLEVNPPPFDLERFSHSLELGPERVEQILVDAVEHIIMCNTP